MSRTIGIYAMALAREEVDKRVSDLESYTDEELLKLYHEGKVLGPRPQDGPWGVLFCNNNDFYSAMAAGKILSQRRLCWV